MGWGRWGERSGDADGGARGAPGGRGGAGAGRTRGVRGWIYHLAVSPSQRRRGIATRLMRGAEATLRALGCPKINLQVRATNQGVIAFYRALGYEIEDRLSMGRLLD